MKIHTLLITTFAVALASAQDAGADPFTAEKVASKTILAPKSSAGNGTEEGAEPLNISICYEDFSLPLAEAAALQREGLSDAEFYAKIFTANGVKQETFSVQRSRSGQKSKTENVIELTYPTEFESAQLSNAVTTGVPGTTKEGNPTPAGALPVPGPVAIARTPATPAAFQTRNLGFTIEIEPTLSQDNKILDLCLGAEHVALLGRSSWGQEFSTVEMPTIQSQRINTAVSIKVNEPFLLGTINRSAVLKEDTESANRVWFAFMTAKLSK
jgi:hypothetical protein